MFSFENVLRMETKTLPETNKLHLHHGSSVESDHHNEKNSSVKLKEKHDHDNDHNVHHDNSVSSVGLCFEGFLNSYRLEKWLKILLTVKNYDLFRYKGVLNIYGDDRKHVFQGVHTIFGSMPFNSWDKKEKRLNKFCFIGRNLDREELTEGFKACLMQPIDFVLRYRIGEYVEIYLEKWRKGVVVKQWDEGHAYRVKLTNGDEVWAQLDINEIIRRDYHLPIKKKKIIKCKKWIKRSKFMSGK